MKYGIFCTPRPKPPQGCWLNDGSQDMDRWETDSLAEAARVAYEKNNLDPETEYKIVEIEEK
jgi:hypothetical protein